MADLYGDFDESGDELEGNDEDIGALESILSWDDEDEACRITESNVLEERNTLTGNPLDNDSTAPHPDQISVYGSTSVTAGQMDQKQVAVTSHQQVSQQLHAQPQQMVPASSQPQAPQQHLPQAQLPQQLPQQQIPQQQIPQQTQYRPVTQPQTYTLHSTAQPLAPAPTTLQPATQTIAIASAPAHAQHQIKAHPAPTAQLQSGTAPATLTQQVLSPAPAILAPHQQPQVGQQLIQTVIGPNGQPTNYIFQQVPTQDPNTYLRHMQIQYQSVPGRPLPPVPLMMPQKAAPLAPAAKPRKPMKKTTPEIAKPAETKSNVVSCSDTDGEARNKKEAPAPAPKKKEPIDTTNMTPEEKAKANRDRNREHARNTRLRKKAYLEKLKTTVDELCRERDTLVSERAGAANLLVEMHNTRIEVLMSFFALRSSYEKQRDLWSSILDESCFSCVMPVTPYRSFPASEVQVSKCQRTILGIDGMMGDTASLHVLLNSLIDRSRYPTATIQFRYTLVTEDAVVAGNQMMARWVMSTVNATQFGARMEVAKQGMLCCKFNSAHKIVGLELMFDVMAFMLQLKQATGSDQFSVIPNTVQTCQRPFVAPMVLTLAERPYTIVQVNKLWEEMTGYKAEEVVGRNSCRVLQGQTTDRNAVEVLMTEVRFKRPASAMFVNYTRQGKLFRNYINIYPLSTDSKITHYVGITAHFDNFDQAVEAAAAAAPQAAMAQQTTTTLPMPQLMQPTILHQAPKPPIMLAAAAAAANPPGISAPGVAAAAALAPTAGAQQVTYCPAPAVISTNMPAKVPQRPPLIQPAPIQSIPIDKESMRPEKKAKLGN